MARLPSPIPIANLPLGASVKSTDYYAAIDTTINPPLGVTNKYPISALSSYINSSVTSTRQSCLVVSITNLAATYANGASGVGATLTASSSGVFITDGVTVPVNSRVLVTGQTSTFQNGIWNLTNAGSISTSWVLTRSIDFNTSTLVQQGALVAVSSGTVNAATIWIETGAGPFTIGTTPIIFTSVSAALAGIIPLNKGGTNANLTANNGAIFSCDATEGVLIPGTPVANRFLYSGASSPGNWTTPTWPIGSGALNHYLVSDGTNNDYSANALSLGGDVSTSGSFTLSGSFTALFNLTGNTNVTFPTSGMLATVGQLYDFVSVTTSTQSILPNIIYYINYAGGQCVLNLPATINLGDVFFVRGNSSGGWLIQASGSQVINIGNVPSSAGGRVASQNQFDAIELSSPATDVLNVAPTVSNQFTIL